MLTKELNSLQNLSMLVPKTQISAFQIMKHCNKNSSLSALDIKLLKKNSMLVSRRPKSCQEPVPYEPVAKPTPAACP